MTHEYTEKSIAKLNTADARLKDIFNSAAELIDITITEGYRNKANQNQAYLHGNSKLQYPNSKHNKSPSMAIDAIPAKKGWHSTRGQFNLMAGIIIGIAHKQGVKIRWGGDWNRNGEISDNIFNDLAHFEIIE